MDPQLAQLYGALLLAGFVLITLEVFIPGGVVGSIGAVALVIAAGVALAAFPGVWGVVASIGAIAFTVAAVVAWMRLFPKTSMGRALTVDTSLHASHSAQDNLASLVGSAGQAVSALRPAGFALFGERRVDVVTRGEMIPSGTNVRVLQVEGNRVVVEAEPSL
jgi:membrane-bound serine protease (ClpP class)